MRTGIIILAGFALWAVCLGAAKWLAGWTAAPTTMTTALVATWFIAAVVKWRLL
jgi:hypothetical protein